MKSISVLSTSNITALIFGFAILRLRARFLIKLSLPFFMEVKLRSCSICGKFGLQDKVSNCSHCGVALCETCQKKLKP
jgi:hypothetical protein